MECRKNPWFLIGSTTNLNCQASTRAQATVDAESSLESAQKTEAQKQVGGSWHVCGKEIVGFPNKDSEGMNENGKSL